MVQCLTGNDGDFVLSAEIIFLFSVLVSGTWAYGFVAAIWFLLGVVEYTKVNAVFTQLCRFCLFTGFGIKGIVWKKLNALLMMQMSFKSWFLLTTVLELFLFHAIHNHGLTVMWRLPDHHDAICNLNLNETNFRRIFQFEFKQFNFSTFQI